MSDEMSDRENLEKFRKEWGDAPKYLYPKLWKDRIDMLFRCIDHDSHKDAGPNEMQLTELQAKALAFDQLIISMRSIRKTTAEALAVDPATLDTIKKTREAVVEMARRLKLFEAAGWRMPATGTPKETPLLQKQFKPTNNWIERLHKAHNDYEPPV